MALKKSYTDGSQKTHPEAYWRLVKNYQMYHVEKWRVVLFIYHDEAARQAKAHPVGYFETWIDENDELPSFSEAAAATDGTGQGMREYLYTIMKDTTELSGATDVLESSSM